MGQPVVFFDIGCRDKDRSSDFYTKLFDWETEPNNPLSLRFKTGSEEGIQGNLTALGHEPHNYVMVYVQVEDLTSYLERAEALGGSTVIPPTEIPGREGHFAWLADPEGTLVGLWKRPC